MDDNLRLGVLLLVAATYSTLLLAIWPTAWRRIRNLFDVVFLGGLVAMALAFKAF